MERVKSASNTESQAKPGPGHPPLVPSVDVRCGAIASAQRRQNILSAVRFEGPAYIPMHFHINEACWHSYPPEVLREWIESHPFLFPEHAGTGDGRTELDYAVVERPGKPFVDGWGCRWEAKVEGMVGSVTGHPLANWADLAMYSPLDPETDSGKGPVDWTRIAEDIGRARSWGSTSTV